MVKINFTNSRHKRRKKILKLAKGYFGSKSNLYRTANEQVMRSLQYAFRDRRRKKRDFRKLWITRINSGCLQNNISYSLFIHGLVLSNTNINRKMLAEMVFSQPEMFKEYVSLSKFYLEQKKNGSQDYNNVILSHENNNNKLIINDSFNSVPNKEIISQENLKNENFVYSSVQKKNNDIDNKNIELEKILVSDLKKIAKKRNIKNFSKLKKKELIDLLKKI
ncbi:50S ribosomal protein L20 [Candidatus Phytoplasma sacchari]|uniref:Large ribosomal subunit protein bL20 n=1 Tax=Candidatus Phytoplasma sacchari TaxID=2609813 RepID=A0ABY7M171_9MOLU|nr:50S ribosomal protein L20 [Candidatus Phytoplasma sacchari]